MSSQTLSIEVPPNFHVITSNEKTDTYAIHYHSLYEIYYFLEGDADYLVEGKEYHLTPDSLVLLSPHTLHGVRVNSNTNYVRCSVHFDGFALSAERRFFLLSAFPGNEKNSPKEVFYEHTEDYELRTFLIQFINAINQPEPLRSHCYPVYLEALLAQITVMSQALRPSAITSYVSDTIVDIIRYLNEHLEEPITLDLLSEKFYISKYYLNRVFKKAVGTTVMDYLNYQRVVMAKQLMLHGHSAANAAVLSGFGDYSTFYRSYRKVMGERPGTAISAR